ncbi:MAG: NifB/NifX family molybdenum-iron cluster-binding protein [Wujia sp.]
MSYKIAVGSSDGIHVDLKFGEVTKFLIYEVADEIRLLEERIVPDDNETKSESQNDCSVSGCTSEGCGGHGNGCNGSSDVISKVELITDCRCVVCKKIGFQAQKQFERKAISVFDVECSIEEALEKITFYYGKIDKHEPFKM